jgi:hypothetical protein
MASSPIGGWFSIFPSSCSQIGIGCQRPTGPPKRLRDPGPKGRGVQSPPSRTMAGTVATRRSCRSGHSLQALTSVMASRSREGRTCPRRPTSRRRPQAMALLRIRSREISVNGRSPDPLADDEAGSVAATAQALALADRLQRPDLLALGAGPDPAFLIRVIGRAGIHRGRATLVAGVHQGSRTPTDSGRSMPALSIASPDSRDGGCLGHGWRRLGAPISRRSQRAIPPGSAHLPGHPDDPAVRQQAATVLLVELAVAFDQLSDGHRPTGRV